MQEGVGRWDEQQEHWLRPVLLNQAQMFAGAATVLLVTFSGN
jgi:hypothetical protein